jgi:hypothetical protein
MKRASKDLGLFECVQGSRKRSASDVDALTHAADVASGHARVGFDAGTVVRVHF